MKKQQIKALYEAGVRSTNSVCYQLPKQGIIRMNRDLKITIIAAWAVMVMVFAFIYEKKPFEYELSGGEFKHIYPFAGYAIYMLPDSSSSIKITGDFPEYWFNANVEKPFIVVRYKTVFGKTKYRRQ
jgi:hypothetical protein